eukprot:PhF_6_TR640/c0_g1_i2/m.892
MATPPLSPTRLTRHQVVAAPNSWSSMTVDPRTELPIIDVPPEYEKSFSDLQGTVMHFFCSVGKYNAKGTLQTRILIISDTTIYLCLETGSIVRCALVGQIQEIILSKPNVMAIKMLPPEYDIMMRFLKTEQRQNAFDILRTIYWEQMGHTVQSSETFIDPGAAAGQLRLEKPKDYTLRVDPIKTKKALAHIVEVHRQHNQFDRSIVVDEMARLKQNLKAEIQKCRISEVQHLIQQNQQLQKEIQEKTEEVEKWKTKQLDLYDPATWKMCPHCVIWRRSLEAHSMENTLRQINLQNELEAKVALTRHMMLALDHRDGKVSVDCCTLDKLCQ